MKTVTEPGRYGDGRGGHGLSLLVKPTKADWLSKTWAQRIRIEGRNHNIGLGSYPLVSLARARARAFENRQAIEEGRNPLHERAMRVPSFADAMEKVISNHRGAWRPSSKSEGQWRASMRDYALPHLGAMPVDRVTSADVLGVLTPIWNETRGLVQRAIVRAWIECEADLSHPYGDGCCRGGSGKGKGNGERRGSLHVHDEGRSAQHRPCVRTRGR